MKTTKNWSKVLLAGMTAMVLAFGLVVVGCDDGNDNGGDGGGSSYDGTYTNGDGDERIVLSGSNFTYSADVGGGSWLVAAKGTFAVSGTAVTINVTHQYNGTELVANPETKTATISSDGKTITLEGNTYTRP